MTAAMVRDDEIWWTLDGGRVPPSKSSKSKTLLCAVLAVLPCRCWPVASRIVVWIWPGFRGA